MPRTCKIRVIRPISVRKTYQRMNYIKLTTNLPNQTNIYRVATYKIRQIRPISVRKTYQRMNYIKLTTNLSPTNTYRVAT